MSIELIEAGSMRSALSGWLGSRDLPKPPSADEVACIDASVNELPTALFYFRDMLILERELFVTPRNHVIWARTSRVDDPRAFTTPAQFKHERHKDIKRIMHQLAGDGVPQDKWRLVLPLCAQTSWTARLSLRDAVRIAKYIGDVALYIHAANKPLAERLTATANELFGMLSMAYHVSPITLAKVLESYKSTPPYTQDLGVGELRHTFGAFTQLQLTMPVASRAQLARHREIMLVDDLVRLLNNDASEQLSIGTPCTVQATALTSTWRHVLGNRTCWMAQADLWAPLAKLFGSETDGLPCAEGLCPFAEDAKQRLAGNDPGAPCPRYSNLTNEPMTRDQFVAACNMAANSNPKVWVGEISAASALVKQES